jgi:hypothetical protein
MHVFPSNKGDTRFNVENSPNVRGKNHERQRVITSLRTEFGYNTNGGGL